MNRVARVWKWLTLCAQQPFFAISLLWKTVRGEEGQKILPLALLHHAILSLHLSNLSLERQGKVTTHNTERGSPALITWALPVDRRAHCKHGATAERYRIKTDFSFPCYWELFCVLGDKGFRFYDEVPSSGSLRVRSYIFSPFCFFPSSPKSQVSIMLGGWRQRPPWLPRSSSLGDASSISAMNEIQVSSSLDLCGVDHSLSVRIWWHLLPSPVSICSNARGSSALWPRGCCPTVQHGCCEAISCLPLHLSSDAGVSASALTHLMLKHVLCSNHQGISKRREVSGWSLMHTDPGARCVSGWITLPPRSHETAPEPRTLWMWRIMPFLICRMWIWSSPSASHYS